MWARKSKGASKGASDTHESTLIQSEWLPLTTTCCDLLFRKEVGIIPFLKISAILRFRYVIYMYLEMSVTFLGLWGCQPCPCFQYGGSRWAWMVILWCFLDILILCNSARRVSCYCSQCPPVERCWDGSILPAAWHTGVASGWLCI